MGSIALTCQTLSACFDSDLFDGSVTADRCARFQSIIFLCGLRLSASPLSFEEIAPHHLRTLANRSLVPPVAGFVLYGSVVRPSAPSSLHDSRFTSQTYLSSKRPGPTRFGCSAQIPPRSRRRVGSWTMHTASTALPDRLARSTSAFWITPTLCVSIRDAH